MRAETLMLIEDVGRDSAEGEDRNWGRTLHQQEQVKVPFATQIFAPF